MRTRFGATGGTDGAPLIPIVVPNSGAFGPPKPTAGAGQVLIQPGAPTPVSAAAAAAAPLRPIKLPSSAELEAQIIAMGKAGASAAQLRPLSEKLLRTKAREAALKVPGLPGIPTGAVLRDDAGRPIGTPAPTLPDPLPTLPRADTPPVFVPGLPSPIAVQPTPAPAADVVKTAGSAIGGRIMKDVLTFALLTSPAWLTILLFPRRP